QRADILDDCLDIGALEDAVAPECRHDRSLPGVGVARTDAVTNGLRDLVDLAAPDPIVVVEVRIALGAARPLTVAGRAIVGEGRAALRAGKREELRVGEDLLQRRRGELADHRSALCLERIDLADDSLARMPVEDALAVGGYERPGWIHDPITH